MTKSKVQVMNKCLNSNPLEDQRSCTSENTSETHATDISAQASNIRSKVRISEMNSNNQNNYQNRHPHFYPQPQPIPFYYAAPISPFPIRPLIQAVPASFVNPYAPTITPQAQKLQDAFFQSESPENAHQESPEKQKCNEFVNLFRHLNQNDDLDQKTEIEMNNSINVESELTENNKVEQAAAESILIETKAENKIETITKPKYIIGKFNGRTIYEIGELFDARKFDSSKNAPRLLENSNVACLKNRNQRQQHVYKRTENAWIGIEERVKDMEEYSKNVLLSKSQIQRAINKFSHNTLEIAQREISSVPIKDVGMAEYVVDCIQKSSMDTIYSREFAKLCQALSNVFKSGYKFFDIVFKEFLKAAEIEPEWLKKYEEIKSRKITTVTQLDNQNEDLTILECKQRSRMLGATKFLAELFNIGVVTPEQMMSHLKSYKLDIELEIEMAIAYYKIVSPNCKNQKLMTALTTLRKQLLDRKPKCSMRLQFMIEEALKVSTKAPAPAKTTTFTMAPDKKKPQKTRIVVSDAKKTEPKVEFNYDAAKKLLTDPFKYFAQSNDIPRFIDELKDIEVSNHMRYFVTFAFNSIIDDSKLSSIYLGQLIVTLLSSGNLYRKDLKDGLAEFAQNIDDYIIDFPSLPEFIAHALIPSIITGNFCASDYFDILSNSEHKIQCYTAFMTSVYGVSRALCVQIYNSVKDYLKDCVKFENYDGLNVKFDLDDILYIPNIIYRQKSSPEEFISIVHVLCPATPGCVADYLNKSVFRNQSVLVVLFKNISLDSFFKFLEKFLGARKNLPSNFVGYLMKFLVQNNILELDVVKSSLISFPKYMAEFNKC